MLSLKTFQTIIFSINRWPSSVESNDDDGQQEMVQLDFQFKRKSRPPVIQEQSRCECEHPRPQKLRKKIDCKFLLSSRDLVYLFAAKLIGFSNGPHEGVQPRIFATVDARQKNCPVQRRWGKLFAGNRRHFREDEGTRSTRLRLCEWLEPEFESGFLQISGR